MRVKNTAGKAVPFQAVRFEIVGDTDTRFTGGKAAVILSTGADGTVTSPTLYAGEKTGYFTVRATVEGAGCCRLPTSPRPSPSGRRTPS